jgi:hypothetical protein
MGILTRLGDWFDSIIIFLSPKYPAYPAVCSVGTSGFLQGVKRPGQNMTTHLHAILKLRMSRATPRTPLYAFMECTLTRSYFTFTFTFILPLPDGQATTAWVYSEP